MGGGGGAIPETGVGNFVLFVNNCGFYSACVHVQLWVPHDITSCSYEQACEGLKDTQNAPSSHPLYTVKKEEGKGYSRRT
jgi:hypothetical protein